MDEYLIYFGVALPLIVVFFIVFRSNKKIEKISIDLDELVKLFNKEDIVNIEFIRNKIVISFKDISNFDVELLHGTYAKGITVVGDKIKFYVSDEIAKNEEVFNSIKNFIER